MPNISSLTMPDGIVYAIKDSQARKDIEDIKKNSSAGSGSSGGGGAKVTITMSSSTEGTADKTASEIISLAQNGFVYAEIIDSSGTGSMYAPLAMAVNFGDTKYAIFNFVNGASGSFTLGSYELTDSKAVHYSSKGLT